MSTPALWKWATASAAALWLRTPQAVQALMVLMVIDYATGFLLAAYRRDLSSEKGRQGLIRKLSMLLMLCATYWLAKGAHIAWDIASPVAIALCINEAISVVENVANTGAPVPSRLLDFLVQAKKIAGHGKTAEEIEKDLG